MRWRRIGEDSLAVLQGIGQKMVSRVRAGISGQQESSVGLVNVALSWDQVEGLQKLIKQQFDVAGLRCRDRVFGDWKDTEQLIVWRR